MSRRLSCLGGIYPACHCASLCHPACPLGHFMRYRAVAGPTRSPFMGHGTCCSVSGAAESDGWPSASAATLCSPCCSSSRQSHRRQHSRARLDPAPLRQTFSLWSAKRLTGDLPCRKEHWYSVSADDVHGTAAAAAGTSQQPHSSGAYVSDTKPAYCRTASRLIAGLRVLPAQDRPCAKERQTRS